MSPDELATCSWPDLPPRYATALRAVVAFVFETFEPRAIVAAGSVVRGAGDRTSDLDIFVVQERPYKQRLQRWFGDVPVEIFVNPARAIRAYFASEHERGRPSAAHMMATGFPVFGGQAIEGLREEAAEWLKKRAVLAPDEDAFARYSAATLLEDGEDVVERDPAMASALLGEAVMAMLRYYLRAERGTVPGDKSLLLEVERSDREIAEAARRFFGVSTIEERQLAARALADRTIRARGFFEWDSERIPVPDD
ncbi:nucleotidyltransferase domain-containing protein [Sorangium atrum]|uniref:Nucleotidyltransferase domain-containing protein n=1 Tax=Sorangium atrum TaxID=2995308 RepID=A0ABT5CDA6_9BACT|nr:nucleotidyltransferase domain-containing protein [Sorangium aterium]MDC0684424.1 nucleotidyltransferase domain-containing protein [Sorangium aterium]